MNNAKQFSSAFTAFLASLALTLLLTPTHAFDESRYQASYDQYLQVSNLHEGSAKKLAAQWQAIHQQDQQEPLALALLGASHTLMGRDALLPWKKMSYTEQGLEELTMAVRLLRPEHLLQRFDNHSVDLLVRVQSAIIYTQVPAFFGYHEDGFLLFSDILSSDDFKQQPAQAKTYVYYYAVQAAQQLGKTEAVSAWQQQLTQLQVNDEFTQAALAIGGES